MKKKIMILNPAHIEGIKNWCLAYPNDLHPVMAFYKHVIPEIDRVQNINHFPECSSTTSKAIYEAMRVIGGVDLCLTWMNKGFSTRNAEVPDWQVWYYPELMIMEP